MVLCLDPVQQLLKCVVSKLHCELRRRSIVLATLGVGAPVRATDTALNATTKWGAPLSPRLRSHLHLSEMLGPSSTADFPAHRQRRPFLRFPSHTSTLACTADFGAQRPSRAAGEVHSVMSQPSTCMRSRHPQATLDFSSLQQSVRDSLQPMPSRSLPEYLNREKIRDRQDSPPVGRLAHRT